MDTFTDIISFPFWLIGAFAIFFGIFATKVTIHGIRVYGTEKAKCKFVLFLTGCVCLGIAGWLV